MAYRSACCPAHGNGRRGFLAGGLAAAGAALAAQLMPAGAAAQSAPVEGAPSAAPFAGGPRIIDTHHHLYPPKYVAQNLRRIVDDSGMLPPSAFQNWTPQLALRQMDEAGISAAVSSITSPGIWFDDGEAARTRARICNEYGARMSTDYPQRFGMFAAIPVPDVEGSLREIEYAYDVLKLEGIGVLTSYAGKQLGDPAFAPVFDELNRRKAVVFVHPTMSCCEGNLFPEVTRPTIEFSTDTARTITSLLFSGTFSRCPDIRFIFSHGGGVLPSIIQRVLTAGRNLTPEQRAARLPKGVAYELNRQYYDIASIALNRAGMAAVLELFPPTQLLYGSDAPFGSTTRIANALLGLGLPAERLRAVQRGNALPLLPRLAAAGA
jgi:6-methylsalicylate decarboxylase